MKKAAGHHKRIFNPIPPF